MATRSSSTTRTSEPFTPREWAVIRAAQASFPFFLMNVFSESFAGRKFRMADGRMHEFSLGRVHYVWADIAQRHPRVCILAPRAHLKSTVLNHAFSFWKLFRAAEDVDGLVISFKEQLAAEHVEKIKSLIDANPYCRFWRDRKPLAESVLDYEVSFGDGHAWRGKMDAHGVFANVRGLHPRFLVCDDILSDFANPLEMSQVKRIDAVFRQSLESLPDESDSLIVIGTPQSYEDTLYRLRANEQYYWARFPAELDGGETLWPEKFDRARLERTRRRVGPTAYQVEYLLVPYMAVDSLIPAEVIRSCVDPRLRPFSLDEPFEPSGILGTYGGMDVGKSRHPSHVSIGALMPTGDVVQIYQEFLDGMDYRQQAHHVRRLIEHFNVRRFYYDATRAELSDRDLTRRAIGLHFSSRTKAQLALSAEARFFAGEDDPGIILLDDDRQVRQISAVTKDLRALETSDGHGDAFWSIALMIRAAEDGPVFEVLGNAQEVFGRRAASLAWLSGGFAPAIPGV
jgi:hypothetical protein